MLKGSTFKGTSVVNRSTVISVAMAAAGILPGTHVVIEPAHIALLRHPRDTMNLRPSVSIAI